jgi:hypothetical protein
MAREMHIPLLTEHIGAPYDIVSEALIHFTEPLGNLIVN